MWSKIKTAEDTGQRRREISSGGGALPHPLRFLRSRYYSGIILTGDQA